ncbi:MAG: cell division protein FtsA [Algoriphagus sp.]|jgi:cell division protein FtsA|uniref:cell division protein FtsA n=1 Tax=Algoriphagus sp. TaxID=1872435 RepID=UPI0027274B5E|nr:cell division protein FtsA [Algoriphagus sp.]MDO8966182.1 cell division protein FtsA [Algoriphagus sp.]MDP2041763.1 cell division protein FtsA [Algoriphagus sp.]MDP3200906.1 cell division protein FtsA [Algoriphagus sp.]MDP3473476.1 cell division protein FtsA [Algoriphagus sp.]
MENDKLIVGLDIGTTKICAIIGRKNEFGKLEVLGMGKAVSDGVDRGIVTNIEKTVHAIQKAVEDCSNMADVNIAEVIVGIAGQHIQSKIMHGSIMRQPTEDEITVEDVQRLSADMHNIVVPPGNSIIHVMPQDYTVDYEGGIKDPVGMAGTRLEADFHIITAQTTAIHNINKCVKKASLESKQLILEPLASSLSVLSDDEKEAGVCLVDIGGGTTDIAIFYENIIRHTAVIPLGGNIITADIKEGCMLMQNQAELLKTRFGKAIAEEANPNEIVSIPGLRNRPPKEISIRNLASIIQARMEEIIEIVQNEIMQSGYYKKLAGGIVITGGGSQLQCISQLFEYMTGLDSRIGFPNEHLGKSVIEEVKSPMYATSVGLVLAGFKALDNREEGYLKRKANSGIKPIIAVKREAIANNFFKGITDRLKTLISDDIGEEY